MAGGMYGMPFMLSFYCSMLLWPIPASLYCTVLRPLETSKKRRLMYVFVFECVKREGCTINSI